jgi:hypothetical protein
MKPSPQKPPSHLTVVQAARFVGVSHGAVSQRIANGKMPSREIEQVVMVATGDCRRWMRERAKIAKRDLGQREQRIIDTAFVGRGESAEVYRADE